MVPKPRTPKTRAKVAIDPAAIGRGSSHLWSEFKLKARRQGWTLDEIHAVQAEAEAAFVETILKYVAEAKE